MSPTFAPPYTSVRPRRAIALPRVTAASAKGGELPVLEPQKTHTVATGFLGIGRTVADGEASKVCCSEVADATHRPTVGPPDDLGLVGSTIDQVHFEACVDAGGFGLIYRGYHEGLGESVAIKCLRIAGIQNTNEEIRAGIAGRFRDETKLLYRLSQGNLDIVRCISSGTLVSPTTREYTPYMVLEWLDGCTLSADLHRRRRDRAEPRSLVDAVQLLDSAALALAHAHNLDVVHRDVKPGNLFLARTREGVRVKVLDFGLAKILSDEGLGLRSSVQTGYGVHFCSPSYGAPEQYSSDLGKIGPWTDVYALCLVLLEVLLQKKVRPAASLSEGLMKALDRTTGSPTASSLGLSLPHAVEDLLSLAVAQEPARRPPDVGSFWGSLKSAMKDNPRSRANATLMMHGTTAPLAAPQGFLAKGDRTAAFATSTLAMTPLPPRTLPSSVPPAVPPYARVATPAPSFAPPVQNAHSSSTSEPPKYHAERASPSYGTSEPPQYPAQNALASAPSSPPKKPMGRGSIALASLVVLALAVIVVQWLRLRGHP